MRCSAYKPPFTFHLTFCPRLGFTYIFYTKAFYLSTFTFHLTFCPRLGRRGYFSPPDDKSPLVYVKNPPLNSPKKASNK